jgi:hypothetical protein
VGHTLLHGHGDLQPGSLEPGVGPREVVDEQTSPWLRIHS